MGILRKKIFRDIAHSKLRASIIVLTCFLASGLIMGINNTAINVQDSFEKMFGELNAYDISVTTEFTSMDLAKQLRDSIVNVKEVDTRIFMKAQLLDVEPKKDFNTNWISIPGTRRPFVNDIALREQGHYFSGPDAPECLVNAQFAKAHDILIGTRLNIKYGNLEKQFTVVSIITSLEYIYCVNEETGILEPMNLGVVFSPLELTQAIFQQPGMVNQFSITIKNTELIDDTVASIQKFFAKRGVIVVDIVKRLDSAETNTYEADMSSTDDIAYAFGSVILVVTIVTIYNSVTKLISIQRNYVGVMAALGGKRRKILFHYFSFTLVLSVWGIISGIILGSMLSFSLIEVQKDFLELPFVERTLHLAPFIKGSIFVLSIALITGLWAAYQSIKITPRDAMTSSFITEIFMRKTLVERVSDLLPGRRAILTRIPIRNLFRRKTRSIITIFTISISMILIISSLSIMESFFGTIDTNFEKNEKYDFQILFNRPCSQDGIWDTLAQIRGVRLAEPYIQSPCAMRTSSSNELQFILLKAYSRNSLLRRYNVVSGTNNLSPSSVLIGKALANELNLTLGDYISIGLATMKRVKIVGITGELADFNLFTTIDEAQEILGFNHTINGLVLSVEKGRKEAVKEALRDRFPVKNILDPTDVKNGFEELLGVGTVMIGMLSGFGIFVEVLFVFNTILLNISEREMEFATLKAIGTPQKRIYKIILFETLCLSILGLVFGIPLGYITTAWVIQVISGGIMYVSLIVPKYVVLLVTILGLLTTVSTALYSARRVDHLNLVDLMRERVIG